MATQSLNVVVIIMQTNIAAIDEGAIYANSTIQSIVNLSVNKIAVRAIQTQNVETAIGVWVVKWMFELTVFVANADVATVQGDMATLITAFPDYTLSIYTYPVTWGF